jgi:hypothetical protein
LNGPIADELANPAKYDAGEKPYSAAEMAMRAQSGQRR